MRELADVVLEPLDLVLLDAAVVLLVVDLTLADFLLLIGLALLDLPAIFLVVFLAAFRVALPAVFLEADEAERLFFITIPSLSPLPGIFCMAALSLPNFLAM